uniref:Uncharacterized protein n=1 Tax=Oncorhynchus tshawytscha TaxID=74940 RepID=A0A8C8IA83_ONCTS
VRKPGARFKRRILFNPRKALLPHRFYTARHRPGSGAPCMHYLVLQEGSCRSGRVSRAGAVVEGDVLQGPGKSWDCCLVQVDLFLEAVQVQVGVVGQVDIRF